MRYLLKNLFLFALVNIGIFCIILYTIHFFFIHRHWYTDPDVFVIPANKTYDVVLLGTSHAQIFTRFTNQTLVENILHKTVFSLAQPNAGPVMEKLYLQFFLEKNNSAKQIVYFIDPHVFYSDIPNENYYLLPYGILDAYFLRDLIENHIGFPTILDYIKTYISLKWFIKYPRPNLPDTRVGTNTPQDQATRLHALYPNGTHKKDLIKYTNVLNQLITNVKKHHMQVIFIIPTTQLPNQPGMEQLKQLLQRYKNDQHINYYDFSHAITNSSLYSDTDHLNTKGVILFTHDYLSHIPELQK